MEPACHPHTHLPTGHQHLAPRAPSLALHAALESHAREHCACRLRAGRARVRVKPPDQYMGTGTAAPDICRKEVGISGETAWLGLFRFSALSAQHSARSRPQELVSPRAWGLEGKGRPWEREGPSLPHSEQLHPEEGSKQVLEVLLFL